MKLSEEQIREIAGSLECGLVCYIHKETKKVTSIMDTSDFYLDDEDLEDEEMEEINNNLDNYVVIEKMSSHEGFQIMADFVDHVSNESIKKRLIYALNNRKPFSNFKYEVDYDEDVRQSWFKFKSSQYQEWVKLHLQGFSDEEE